MKHQCWLNLRFFLKESTDVALKFVVAVFFLLWLLRAILLVAGWHSNTVQCLWDTDVNSGTSVNFIDLLVFYFAQFMLSRIFDTNLTQSADSFSWKLLLNSKPSTWPIRIYIWFGGNRMQFSKSKHHHIYVSLNHTNHSSLSFLDGKFVRMYSLKVWMFWVIFPICVCVNACELENCLRIELSISTAVEFVCQNQV